MDFDILDSVLDDLGQDVEALLETSFDLDLPSLGTLFLATDIGSDLLPDSSLVDSLLESTGTLDIEGFDISGTLTVDGVDTDIDLDLETVFAELNTLLTNADGTLLLEGGELSGSISTDDSEYLIDIDVESLLADSLTSLFTSVDFVAPFSNGVFTLDIETALGDITGTLDFADGDLDIDLTESPFGTLQTSLDFPDDSQFSIPINDSGISELELDLADGTVRVPIAGIGSVPIELPLTLFSGALEVSDGEATLDIDLGTLVSVEADFDIGMIASELAAALVEDLDGEITLTDGEIVGSFTSQLLGTLEFTETVDDVLTQAAALIEQTSGVISLDSGTADVELDTPLGSFSGDLALSGVADFLQGSSPMLAA